ncbi:hypothetical protein [Burkholderia plantarii]|uniref:hypothetical protein n=1 Tax=Burkholderia plantarii TaxID=41899 RepID=UPI0018DD5FC3|nr:hypothetical protein [Burkholderia plantarii]MBI0328312.1 hypothetical protein [Burkholderia plantarii]
MKPLNAAVIQIPPMPDPDPGDLPGQDDLPDLPPEPLRDPQRVPPLPVNGPPSGGRVPAWRCAAPARGT